MIFFDFFVQHILFWGTLYDVIYKKKYTSWSTCRGFKVNNNVYAKNMIP